MVQQKLDEKKSEGSDKPEEPVKRKRTRKNLPSVGYLLAHGDPETAHLPKTWCQILGFPISVGIVFFISLLTFHYAPHSKSKHAGFKLPRKNAPPIEHMQIPIPEPMDPVPMEPLTENEL